MAHRPLREADLAVAGMEREKATGNDLARHRPFSVPPPPPMAGPPPEAAKIKGKRRPLSVKQIATGHDPLGGPAPRSGRAAPPPPRKAGSRVTGAPPPPLLSRKQSPPAEQKQAAGKPSAGHRLFGKAKPQERARLPAGASTTERAQYRFRP